MSEPDDGSPPPNTPLPNPIVTDSPEPSATPPAPEREPEQHDTAKEA